VLQRIDHKFSTDCLPGAYCGRLLTAPVVLLFLSPGLDPGDPAHCADQQGRRYYARQRAGESDLPDLKEHEAAHNWLTKVIGQFGISYEEARSTVATLNIGAYKSKSFHDWGMLASLPSSRVALDWAQSVLFPQAVDGERVVVCLRSPNYWGLGVGEPIGVSLFRPQCTRSAFMHKGSMRDSIVTKVQAEVQKALLAEKRSR